ncbi:MAG: hypothetical protein II852_13620 [Bacteroidales bacterium]|nr:hypothetical protein [Bacteroidales bacterium]
MTHPPHIILTAILLLALLLPDAHAQTDTQSDLRLFRKAATSDTSDAANISVRQTANQTADSIAEYLRTLQSLYSAGKYNQVLTLSRQMQEQHSLSKDDNTQRLKYTIAAYKDLDCNREADSVAKLFRQRDPFYEVSVGSDPVSFQEVVDNYYTMPKFSVWVAAGKAFIKPQLDTVHNILASEQQTPTYSTESYMVQLGIEYRPLRILTVSLAPLFSIAKYERSSSRSSTATFYYKEESQTVALPLYVEASLLAGRSVVEPSFYAGVQVKYLIRSRYQAYEETVGKYTKIPAFADNLGIKNRLNTSVLGGIRLYINGRGRITYFGDFGVAYDLNPYNVPSKKFDNASLMFDKSYVPDIFHILELTAKIGVKINLQYKTIAKYKYGY